MINNKIQRSIKRVTMFALLVIPFTMQAQIKTQVIGKVGNKSGQKIFLSYVVNGAVYRDSTYLKKGKFEFNVSATELIPATLRLQHESSSATISQDSKEIYIEPGQVKITAKDSLLYAKIEKGQLSKEFAVFREVAGLEELKTLARLIKQTTNENKLKAYKDRRDELLDNMRQGYINYVKAYPDSYFSLFALNYIGSGSMDVTVIEPLFLSLSERLRNSADGQVIQSQIETVKGLKVGEIAPVFSQTDATGNVVSLDDFKGKYVLLDFWASWCVPCRQDNPNLVKAYEKYKDKNFTILGVSLDKNKQAWLDAIHKDGLTWTNVSDLGYFKNAVAVQYAIRAIPQNYLLDPTGRIIAIGLHGDELERKLEELLKK